MLRMENGQCFPRNKSLQRFTVLSTARLIQFSRPLLPALCPSQSMLSSNKLDLKKKKIYVAAGWWRLCACVWLCGFVPMSWHTKGPLFIHLNSDRGPKKHVGYSGPQRSTSVTISLQSVTRKTCCCFSMKSSTVCFALFTFKCSVNQL